jgi:glycosyltransferase involved in cell wall biosynthesis
MPRSFAQTYSHEMAALVDAENGQHDAALALGLGAGIHLRHGSGMPRILDEVEVATILEDYRKRPPGLTRLRRGLTWWKYARFVRDLTKEFERTTAVSEHELQHLLAIGCERRHLAVIANGVDAATLQYTRTTVRDRLIYPGSVTYGANLDAVRYLVDEILPLIRAVRPAVHLMVTGDVGDVDTTALIAAGGITFTGQVPDVRQLIAESAVCVVPLRIGGGTRLKILEAAAIGTPVVSTPKGAEGLVFANGRDLLTADTADAFARETLRLLNDRDFAQRMAANARQIVEESYLWDRIGAQLNDVIVDAVSTRQRFVSIDRGEKIRAVGA